MLSWETVGNISSLLAAAIALIALRQWRVARRAENDSMLALRLLERSAAVDRLIIDLWRPSTVGEQLALITERGYQFGTHPYVDARLSAHVEHLRMRMAKARDAVQRLEIDQKIAQALWGREDVEAITSFGVVLEAIHEELEAWVAQDAQNEKGDPHGVLPRLREGSDQRMELMRKLETARAEVQLAMLGRLRASVWFDWVVQPLTKLKRWAV